jgi:hypothetical protein
MGPFWTSFFEHLKDCGRDATLFMMALAGFIAVLVILAILESTWLREYFLQGALVLLLFVLIRFALLVRRFRARRRERLRFPPLSRDELRVARSKLVKDRN